MNRFLHVLLTSCLLFCSAARAAEPKSEAQGITQITVQRTWCYGDCPIDSFTLDANGSATYSGLRSQLRSGFFKGNTAKEDFARLTEFLQDQNYFELKAMIGDGNVDAPDFLVSVTRDGSHFCVVLRSNGSPQLKQKIETTFLAVADKINWQRDEQASIAGIRGQVTRPLSPDEARGRNAKPPVKALPFKFALVELESLDHPGIYVSTRTDQKGHFQLFAVPGRYTLAASESNASVDFRFVEHDYEVESSPVEVKSGKFTDITLVARE